MVAVLALVSLAASLYLSWNAFRFGFAHRATDLEFDTSGAVWTNAWVAHAIAHFRNPFFSPNLMHPFGINLLANAYNVGFSAAFAPVTWLFGPIASFNAQVIFIPIANTIVMGMCLRRFVKEPWLAVAGGIVWGFSPFVVATLARGWTNVAFLVLPPIVLWLIAELFSDGGWSPRRIGVWLAVAIVIQYFIDSEVLVMTAAGAAVGIATTLIVRRAQWSSLWPRVMTCTAWTVVPSALLLAAPISYGLFGPHPMPNWVSARRVYQLFVSPLFNDIFKPNSITPAPNPHFGRSVNAQYIGLGMPLVILVGLIVWRLPKRTRPFLAVGLFALWMSVGYGPWWSSYRIVEHLPLLHNLNVTRYISLALFASIILVLLIAQMSLDTFRSRFTKLVAAWLTAAVVAVAFVPPLVAVATTTPLTVSYSVGDKALPKVLARPGHHVIMTFPFPASVREMIQQALAGDFSYDMPGGQWPQIFDAPEPAGTVNFFLRVVSRDQLKTAPNPFILAELQHWLHRWGVTDVIVPMTRDRRVSVYYRSPKQFAAVMTQVLGPPRLIRGELVWVSIRPRAQVVVLTNAQWIRCVRSKGPTAARVPACVMGYSTHAIG